MKIITKNKRAYSDYSFEKDYQVGIVLRWHEVKSIKSSQVNIKDAIVKIEKWELWIINMDIPLYSKTANVLVSSYNSKARRKLLINKRELAKISAMVDKSYAVIPLEVYINDKRLIKLKIWVGKIMRKIEKKVVLKEKDTKRQMEREIKNLRIS